MHKIWLLYSLMPIVAYSKICDKEIVFIDEHEDLMHLIVNDEPYVQENLPSLFQMMGFEDEEDLGHGVLEIDEGDKALLPWTNDPLVQDTMPHFIEKQTNEMVKEIDDPYGYEFSEKIMGKKNHPSLEKVEKSGQSLYPEPLEPKTIHQQPIPQQTSDTQAFGEYLKAEEKEAMRVNQSEKQKSSKKRQRVKFLKRK